MTQPRAGTESSTTSPVTILYFYKTRWGHHDEFVGLFERNHWPLLREGLTEGRLLEVRRWVPRFHGEGRADWDVLISITYADWAAVATHTPRGLTERLFPDRDRHEAEERRRFEILEAHWDVVLEERPLG